MEAMKVLEGSQVKKFSDIKIGDRIEIEETVDLKLPNQNDENLISLEVRIIK
jgi:hypothetical protein